MVTKEELINMDKKGIETLFNSFLSDVTTTNIDPSLVKAEMILAVNNNLTGFKVRAVDYHNNNVVISLGLLSIRLKVSVKSTGKIVAVSKLRSKHVKGKGGFKIDEINYKLSNFVFIFDDEKKCTIKIQEGWSRSGLPSIKLEKCDGTLKDICTRENLMKIFNLQQQSYIDYENDIFKRRGESLKENYKGIEYEFMSSMAQPVIKKHCFSWDMRVDKTWLKFIPKEYQTLMPNKVNHENIFEVVIRTVGKINENVLNDVMDRNFPENYLTLQD
jgi:hypothetical protein